MGKWESREIEVAHKYLGTQKVKADCYEQMAVHRTLGSSSLWTLTHIPTGMATYWEITSKTAAKVLAVRLAPSLPKEGQLNVVPPDWRQHMEAALPVLRTWWKEYPTALAVRIGA